MDFHRLQSMFVVYSCFKSSTITLHVPTLKFLEELAKTTIVNLQWFLDIAEYWIMKELTRLAKTAFQYPTKHSEQTKRGQEVTLLDNMLTVEDNRQITLSNTNKTSRPTNIYEASRTFTNIN